MKDITGGCLCGKITYKCKADFRYFHLCHCKQCQKSTGSAHRANVFTDEVNLSWLSGVDLIKRYDVPGRAISNAFCTECGSALPYLSLAQKIYVVPVGTLDEPPGIDADAQIFWDERADWVEHSYSEEHCPRFGTFAE